jgi:hypothetical protein
MPTPASVAHYVVERELGRGAMGVVLLARDTKLGRLVAIKSLPDDFARDAARRTRFIHESRILASINHPNVAAVYGVEEADEGLFIVLELAEGDTLADRLAARSPLPMPQAVDIGRQIARGLDAAHRQGVVHRDLKPANIKLRPDGVVKILDFGIAHAGPGATRPQDATIVEPTPGTSTGAILGTPGYMSPEQVRGRAVGPQTDIWALGCVLYECLTGRPAFDGESQADLLAATLMAEPDWSGLPAGTPRAVAALLRACLQKDPAKRPAAILDAAETLHNVLNVVRSPPAPSSAFHSSPPRPTAPVPPFATPLVARARETDEVAAMLRASRVVTLTGLGGCGKTRVAAQAASASGFTPCWVPLAPVSDPVYVRRAVARAARAEEDSPEAIAEVIADRPILFILDSVQHAPGPCAALTAHVAAACPNVRVLSTGLNPLGLAGEAVYALTPLESPAADDATGRFEAATLFLARARAANPAFAPNHADAASIASLCRTLGGFPLAIELVASAASTPVARLADRIEQRARLIGHAPRLDHSLTLAIEWRWDLLTPPERGILKRLSVFPGGATAPALAAVCGSDESMPRVDDDTPFDPPLSATQARFAQVLQSLQHAGMTRVWQPDPARPEAARWSLPAPVYTFAHLRLREAVEEPDASARLTRYFTALVECAEPRLDGPTAGAWARRLAGELANLHAAAVLAAATGRSEQADRLRAAAARTWAVE